jgi:Leucine-rich repeat (LRR) protein
LTNLQYLHLSNNQLTSIPDRVRVSDKLIVDSYVVVPERLLNITEFVGYDDSFDTKPATKGYVQV